jgi:hypothetical protein
MLLFKNMVTRRQDCLTGLSSLYRGLARPAAAILRIVVVGPIARVDNTPATAPRKAVGELAALSAVKSPMTRSAQTSLCN